MSILEGPRVPLSTFERKRYDIVIVGGGINGGSLANHLAAEGYSVLVVEKNDFGGGASSRSSKLLHCGLAGLAPRNSAWDFVRHPTFLLRGLKAAREMAKAREEFVVTMPGRVRAFTFCYPIYADGPYSGWQLDAAFKMLTAVGGTKVPLDYARLDRRAALDHPMAKYLADPDRLVGMVTFREYQFEFAERIVMDTLMEAQRSGADLRNYTAATTFREVGDIWEVQLADMLEKGTPPVTVEGRALMNLTGAWIDEVNSGLEGPLPKRLISNPKGVHIMLKLPPELRDVGLIQFTPDHKMVYVVPWRGMHYAGPGDAPYSGPLDDAVPSKDDVTTVLNMFSAVLPTLPLSRDDVHYAWAGIQPRTFDPLEPEGTWSRQFHNLGRSGGPGYFALTGATIGRSRMSGRDGVKLVKKILSASGTKKSVNYGPHQRPAPSQIAIPCSNEPDGLSDVAYAVEMEQARTLEDVMFRRIGLGWDEGMGLDRLPAIAAEMQARLGWSDERLSTELAAYRQILTRRHLLSEQQY